MANRDTTGRPGDVILDRYMPKAMPAEREEARNNLRAYARVLLEINKRLASEGRATDSREMDEGPTI